MKLPLLRLLSLLVLLAGSFAVARPPNVVLIMADDMGYECLTVNGGKSYETPRLDALAEQGIRFTNAYSTPLCTPSRVQIMTGRYNAHTYEEFGYLNPKHHTFGHLMKEAGYATMIAGKWQLNGISHGPDKFDRWDDSTRPRDAGFDEWSLWQITEHKREGERFWDPLIEENGTKMKEELVGTYGPDHFTNYICDFIERKKDEPFFVYYPMVLVHDPFVHTPDSTTTELSHQEAFADMMKYCDKLVGRIHDKLAEEGLLEDTIIIFTGDNGTPRQIVSEIDDREITGGKGQTIDDGIHVPFIASWKGHAPAGLVTDQLVDFTDVKATLYDLVRNHRTDSSPDLELDGISILPTLKGEPGLQREWIFCHYEPRWGRFRSQRSAFAYDGSVKVYHDGRIFAATEDALEENALNESEVSAKALSQLRKVIAQFPQMPEEETPFGEPLFP
ncbi:MAG: sulfatase-like hydrolase/transferase [Synoicihabitans sp.]